MPDFKKILCSFMLSEKVICEDGVQNYPLKSIFRHTYVSM